MEFFRILAGSWPITVMFIAFMGTLVTFYIIRSSDRNAEKDRAYRSSQAVVVRDRRSDD